MYIDNFKEIEADKNNNEICWIFGPTASGKKTLILETINNNTIINKILNNYNSIVIPIIPYIKENHNGKKHKDNNKRYDILNSYYEYYKYTAFKTLYLIHGQGRDLSILDKLKLKYEMEMVNCFYLHVNEETYLKRCSKRNRNITYEDAYKNKSNIINKLKKYFKNVYEINQ